MDKNAPSFLKATLIGGAAAGFVAGLPFFEYLNCLCCALVVAGGFLAGFLYSRECAGAGFAFGPPTGATVGLVAGLFYAITETTVKAIRYAAGGGEDMAEVVERLEEANIPPETLEQIEVLIERFASSPGLLLMLSFLMTLLIAAVFSTVGGLIAGVSFKVEPAPPAGGMTPPPPAPPFDGAGPSDPPPPQA